MKFYLFWVIFPVLKDVFAFHQFKNDPNLTYMRANFDEIVPPFELSSSQSILNETMIKPQYDLKFPSMGNMTGCRIIAE